MVQRSTICCVLILITISGSFANEIDDVANRLAGSLSEAIFSLHTSDTHQSMDCSNQVKEKMTNLLEFSTPPQVISVNFSMLNPMIDEIGKEQLNFPTVVLKAQ